MTQDEKTAQTKILAYRAAAGAAILGGLAVALPVIHGAFLAGLGIVGILGTGVIGACLIKALPLVAQKVENKLLKAQIAEAAANPIETRIKIAERERLEIERAGRIEAQVAAKIATIENSLKAFKAAYPTEDVADHDAVVAEARTLHVMMGENIRDSAAALNAYEARTKMLSARLQLALGVESLAQALNPESVQRAYDTLFSETATQAVDERLISGMASLRQVARQVEMKKLLDGAAASRLAL